MLNVNNNFVHIVILNLYFRLLVILIPNICEENGDKKNTNKLSSSVVVSKLQLRQKHILEDVDEVKTQLLAVKPAEDMIDSEVISFMRESKTWSKKIEHFPKQKNLTYVEDPDKALCR